jgi:glycosyltransferase involved in cell wall biosynthesis
MKPGSSDKLKQSELPKVVWDGLGLFNTHSGVGHYGANLYKNLALLGLAPDVTALAGRLPTFVTNGHSVVLQTAVLGRRTQGLKPVFPVYSYRAASYRHQEMIYHGLSNKNLPCFGLSRSADKFVITIHDIIPILVGSNSALAIQMKWLMPRVLERADRVITGSAWAKESVMEVFGAKYGDKITPLGYGTIAADDEGAVDVTYDCLTIARGESYKRLEMISEIARVLPDKRFVVVTDRAGENRLGVIPPNIKVFSSLEEGQLSRLMKSARVLLHPSLLEGWCLPAAEALCAGLNVIYCSGSGIDEVCAHAPGQVVALHRDNGPRDWAEALDEVLKRPKAGTASINFPTWEEVAQKTLKLYQSLV